MHLLEKIFQYFTIKRSGYFDKEFYLKTYPEIRDSGLNPTIHYITQGWKENHDPGPNFSTSWYLKTYPDVKKAKINPLYHYLMYGKKEGRQIKKLPSLRENTLVNSRDTSVDFIIVGAQRAGTTSLFKFLDLLPSFCGSPYKEVGFFSIDENYAKGSNWYHQQFETCSKGQLKFEATPEYLYYPFVPSRINNYNSDMRFVVLFRDPVDRCYSAWKLFKNIYEKDQLTKEKIIKHSKGTGKDNLANLMVSEDYPDFTKAVHDDLGRYYQNSNILEPSFVRRGLYHHQLSHWLKYFDITQFLFLEINELNQLGDLLKKIRDFLGIELDIALNDLEMPEYNKLSGKKNIDIDQETLSLLQNFYHEYNIKLFKLINKTYDWNV